MGNGKATVLVEDVQIPGHKGLIKLRCYRPLDYRMRMPIVLYFHGGGFVGRSPAESKMVATAIACGTPAWVIAVDYSLSPDFPFPTALEDGYRALQWAVANARLQKADLAKLAVVGHEAGAHLATCLAAMIRDRGDWNLSGQALLAPLLDPSMTRIAKLTDETALDLAMRICAANYRAYLPDPKQRMHPYAAPIESRRLFGLPSTFIATSAQDIFSPAAQAYAAALAAAGVPVEIKEYPHHKHQTHYAIAVNARVVQDLVDFLMRCLASTLKSTRTGG